MCQACHSTSWRFEPVDGRATLFTYTVVTGAGGEAALPGESGHPFAVAVVELELEDPVRMVTDIDTEWLDRIAIGMPMRVEFEPVSAEIHLPRFLPAEPQPDQPQTTGSRPR